MLSIQDYLNPERRYIATKEYATGLTSPVAKARPDQEAIEAWLLALACARLR